MNSETVIITIATSLVGVAAKVGMLCLQTKITNSGTEDGLCFSLDFVRYFNKYQSIYLKLCGRKSKTFVLELDVDFFTQ